MTRTNDTTATENQSIDSSAMTRTNAVPVVVAVTLGVLVGALVAGPVAAVVLAVALGAAATWAIRRFMVSLSDPILDQLDLHPADDHRHARLLNVLDGLCVVSGDRRPEVHILDDPRPLAMVVATPAGVGHLVAAEGLLATMDRMETEAVVSHLLWRLRSGHGASATYAVAVTRVLGKVGLAAVARRLWPRFVIDAVPMWADIAACQATRYPPAMISALEKCERHEDWGHLDRTLGTMAFVDPATITHDATSVVGLSNVGTSVPTVGERIAVLKEI